MNATLLRRLLDSRGAYVPLDELGADQDATHRDLSEIEAFGLTIERHPLFGVACIGPSSRLCPDQIEHALGTHRIGRRVSVWNRVSSTNDLAARAASSRANEGLVVLAEEQTAGRGRRGRSWSAPAGGSILMSVLLFPDGPLADPAWLTALAAVAVAEVVARWTGRVPRIKWPNDVRVGGKKIAGILVERGAGVVVGIGVNANVAREDFPPDLRETATSLSLLLGGPVDRSELARALIQAIDARYESSTTAGPGMVSRLWREQVELLGENTVVSTPAGPRRGRLIDIDLVRGLVLSAPDDSRVVVAANQVLSIVPDEDLA